MIIQERIALIELAIDDVLNSLSNGIEIKEYQIENVRIVKRSPFELIAELRKIRKMLIADARANKKAVIYHF